MNTDIRVDVGFLDHWKTDILLAECGAEGVLALMRLWIYAAQNKPDGRLTGITDKLIERVAKWKGESGQLLHCIVENRFIEQDEEGIWFLHDWEQHNPYAAGAEWRRERAKKANAASQQAKKAQPSCYKPATSELQANYKPAPLPPPPPSPSPTTTTTPNPSTPATPVACPVIADCGGGEEIQETQVTQQDGLVFPTALEPYHRQQAETLMQSCPPEQAQALLDELAAALQQGKVKSPVGYLRALIQRARDGTFIPENGQRIAQERLRRYQSASAVHAALRRKPDPLPDQTKHDVSSHIAALRAALTMPIATGQTA